MTSKPYSESLAPESWKSSSARNQSQTILKNSGGVRDPKTILGVIGTGILEVCDCEVVMVEWFRPLTPLSYLIRTLNPTPMDRGKLKLGTGSGHGWVILAYNSFLLVPKDSEPDPNELGHPNLDGGSRHGSLISAYNSVRLTPTDSWPCVNDSQTPKLAIELGHGSVSLTYISVLHTTRRNSRHGPREIIMYNTKSRYFIYVMFYYYRIEHMYMRNNLQFVNNYINVLILKRTAFIFFYELSNISNKIN